MRRVALFTLALLLQPAHARVQEVVSPRGGASPADPARVASPREDGRVVVSVGELDKRARGLAAKLGPADADARRIALDELAEVEAALREHLAVAAGDDLSRVHLALYRILCARGQHHPAYAVDEQIRELDEARDHALASGSREALARARLIKGTILRLDGQYEEAWNELDDIVRAVPEAKNVMPFVLHARAELERVRGRYTDALATLDLCEARRPDGPAWAPLKWRVAGSRGHIYLELGVFDLAAQFIAEESELCGPLRDYGTRFKKDLISMHLHAASLALGQGLYTRAVKLVDRCLEDAALYDGEDRWRSEMLLIEGLARSALERDRPGTSSTYPPDRADSPDSPESAEAVLRAALALSDLVGRERARCEMQLASLGLRRGDLDEASRRLQVASEELSRFRAERSRDDLLAEDVDLATLRVKLALARGAGVEVLSKGAENLAAAIQVRLEQWSMAPLRAGGLGFLHPPSRRGWLSELSRALLRVYGEERGAELAVEQLMSVQAMGTLVRSRGYVVGGLVDVRERVLDSGRGMLVYLSGPDRSHVFAIDQASSLGAELANHGVLEALARRYRGVVAAATDGAGMDRIAERAASAALSAGLLPPRIVERVESWTGLTIVGTEMLGAPPFAVLQCGGMDALGLALPVDELPSLPLGLLLADRATPVRDLDLLLVAAPEVEADVRDRFADLSLLPFTKSTADRFAAAYGRDRVDLWIGADATRARLLATDLSRYRVVQFLLHGVQDDRRERPSSLVLGGGPDDPGLVPCEDVEGRAAPDLVLLTSCRAGIGPMRMGDDGVGHLGGAFLAAGAKAVLLPDQDLSFRLAVELSALMHPALARGASPAEALRLARRGLLDDGVIANLAETAHLRILGLGQRRIFAGSGGRVGTGSIGEATGQTSHSRWWWLVLLALFSAAALWFHGAGQAGGEAGVKRRS